MSLKMFCNLVTDRKIQFVCLFLKDTFDHNSKIYFRILCRGRKATIWPWKHRQKAVNDSKITVIKPSLKSKVHFRRFFPSPNKGRVNAGENRPSEWIFRIKDRSRKFRRQSTIRKNFHNYIVENFVEGRKEKKYKGSTCRKEEKHLVKVQLEVVDSHAHVASHKGGQLR